ncbi:GNAT family N-acetyltransferase [Mobilitalea sibirica]|uniref:GNAT family N-acetyltransferase n=1 Tax=Mobilitalea sibirica TaxID=1462919 RepID=A0A8J7HCH9_9FIRM|nr:GNAT family protein [Mobilitalea sibirica]MBH1942101.1 GNAT family N-acetyltransferase [Mobilitalea sibirica]
MSISNDPYLQCPSYEANHFIIRQVKEDDAKDLLACYSDPVSAPYFNSDNCTSNFVFHTEVEVLSCIRFWLMEYENKNYVRFSIVDKIINKAIGTIEIFAKEGTFHESGKVGILRLDLASEYENREDIGEILDLINDTFYETFHVDSIATKAIPEAVQRIEALKTRRFIALTSGNIVSYDNYFIAAKQKQINISQLDI